MKGNIAFLFLTIIFWEFVCADPRVKFNSKSQLLRKNKKANVARETHLREDEDRNSQKLLNSEDEPDVRHTSKPPTIVDDELSAGKRRRESKMIKLVGDYNKYVERPLAAGDTFTAGELLPVTQKLFEKEGKGIVSSAKSPQDLADKIFQEFFLTTKRIVTLTDLDISGLDALQSLALAGDVATDEKFSRRAEKKIVLNVNGQLIKSRAGKKQSQYNMLHKVSGRRTPQEGKRKGDTRSKLLNKLGKNRHLVVSKRKNMNDKNANKNVCRWSYECEDPGDLDTCKLKTKCMARRANEKVDHTEYINSNLDIDPSIAAQFRKSLSIDVLDEEVEKIIERKIIIIKPENELSEIEGLSDYFRKILESQKNAGQKGEMTPMPKVDESSVEHRDTPSNVKKMNAKATDSDTTSTEGPNDEKSQAAEGINARRA